MDRYPYTNFHELNLVYFIRHFREIFEQWASLYDEMQSWKTSTTAELEAWKTETLEDLQSWETALLAELDAWKTQTGADISAWETATLAALTAWQTAAETEFEAIRVEAAGSATAAAASASDAATAKTAAETAQAAAEAAAADIASSAAQIATNTADITALQDIDDTYLMPFYGPLYSKNMLHSDADLTPGYIAANGTIYSSTTLAYTDYIPVNPGDVIRAYDTITGVFGQKSMRFLCAYNAGKTRVTSAGSNDNISSYTVPDGIYFIRPTVNYSSARSHYAITINYRATEYSEYMTPAKPIIKDFVTDGTADIIAELSENRLPMSRIRNRLHQAYPISAVHFTKGISETWYYASAVTPPTNFTYVTVGADNQTRYTDRMVIDPLSGGNNGYKWYRYDDLMYLYASGTGPSDAGWARNIIDEQLLDCSALVIGDSTVAMNSGYMTQKMLDRFTAQTKTLTLLGTLGSAPNKYEGRAGWSAADYLTNKTYEGVVNPFYNPSTQTFDFDYYMTNQNYSAPDFVVIQLGINDLYNSGYAAIDPTWTAIKTMIDSIRDYDAGIKIILNLPTTPNSDQNQHSGIEFLYRSRVITYNEKVLTEVAGGYGDSRVRCSYCHLILDPETDIRDNVHPTAGGYTKMANETVSQMNCWLNNV